MVDLASPHRVRKSRSPQLPGRRPGPVLSSVTTHQPNLEALGEVIAVHRAGDTS